MPVPQPPELAQEIAAILPMQKAQVEFAALNEGLLKASSVGTPADLAVLAFPLNRSLSALQGLSADLTDSRLRSRFEQRLADFEKLIEGPDSLLDARRSELRLVEEAERLQAENAGLSDRLTEAVDALVAAAGHDIREAGADALIGAAGRARRAPGRRRAEPPQFAAHRLALRRPEPARAVEGPEQQHAGHCWGRPCGPLYRRRAPTRSDGWHGHSQYSGIPQSRSRTTTCARSPAPGSV